jgi:ketosteroid isomerase-like protein
MTRDELESVVRGYLIELDALDLEAVAKRFSDDAAFIVQTGHVTLHGRDQIRDLWQGLFAAHERMEHRVAAVVADPETRKVATEQSFVGLRRDGTREERHSVYLFDIADDGRFTRVIVWIDGETPEGE